MILLPLCLAIFIERVVPKLAINQIDESAMTSATHHHRVVTKDRTRLNVIAMCVTQRTGQETRLIMNLFLSQEISDYSDLQLKALLDEAITYKNRKDLAHKSETFKVSGRVCC